mmetsp:Transcript_4385/g.10285  ORF Transcript_4385/g.10285 Transcript_4385/m.10285 type:complete len:121 (-) Transcript_4385:255-617(-)
MQRFFMILTAVPGFSHNFNSYQTHVLLGFADNHTGITSNRQKQKQNPDGWTAIERLHSPTKDSSVSTSFLLPKFDCTRELRDKALQSKMLAILSHLDGKNMGSTRNKITMSMLSWTVPTD